MNSVRRLLPACAAAVLAACGSDSSGTTQPPAPAPVATITLSGLPDSAYAGENATATATLRDANGNTLTGRTITWTSSDTLAATVGTDGAVAFRGYGPFTITATSEGRTATANSRAVLARKADRFAYAIVTATASAASVARTTNATGGAVRATTNASGDAIVTFERLARADTAWRETVMLSRSGSLATRCHLNSWGAAANKRDLEVSVSCYATDGTKLPGQFNILVFGNGTLDGRHGFIESTDATATHTPDGARFFNSSGAGMAITRNSTGSYTVQVNNPRGSGKTENYFVTTIGPAAATCNLNGWSFGNTSSTACYTAGTVVTDARFTMQLVEAGRPGKRWAFAWANGPAAALDQEYTPSALYQASSNGQSPMITRTTANTVTDGIYRVRFPGLGALGSAAHHVQVSAYNSGANSCFPDAESTVNAGADLVVAVQCYNRYSGTPANAFFTILLIE